jgi:hypothetical protein
MLHHEDELRHDLSISLATTATAAGHAARVDKLFFRIPAFAVGDLDSIPPAV